MTGLEKMKSQILEEARALADRKLAEADRQAKELLEAARAEAEKEAFGILQKGEKEAAEYRERTASSIDLQRRVRILAAKQEAIGEILAEAYDSLKQMEPEKYFAMLLRMVEKYALPQEGVIYFSKADRKRMPAGFEEKVKKKAEEKGGRLEISEEEREGDSGFVLAYGGIEENCTWKAIFDARRDELADAVQHVLF